MKCLECGVPITVKSDVGDISVDEEFIKYQSHMLWHHPTVQDMDDLVDSISAQHEALMHAYASLDSALALQISIDLVDKTMRFKKYMEIELEDEIS